MVIIPTFSDPFYTQITTLDGIPYLLNFRFNTREGAWYLQIATSENEVIAQGIKIVTNYRLLQKYADSRMPQGEMICFSFGNDDSTPGMNDLGIGLRCELWYYPKADLPVGTDAWRLP